MEGYIVHGGIGMARGSLARIEDGKGVLVYLWEGELHITQERDRRDYFVKPGGWFQLDREGVALVYALRRSHVTLTAPVAAHYARRISMRIRGSSKARLIYDRAQGSAGWLQGLRHRLSRLWTNSYYRHSNPTTAAL
jgi:hypothetical protein